MIGPWGSGKSTLLNFASSEIEALGEDWEVKRFNPWLFSDTESLVSEFFKTLRVALSVDLTTELREKLARYSHAVAPFGALAKLVGFDATKMIEALAGKLDGDLSIEKARDDLSEALSECDTKFVVVIDDLDRLLPEELLLVLKLIRLVGSLPHIYYLLAYDEATLLDVLGTTELARGNESRALTYLEKIVQVRLDIPPMSARHQSMYFSEGFQRVLGDHDLQIALRDTLR
jgi:predicted KAP-like P-loop ATPase